MQCMQVRLAVESVMCIHTENIPTFPHHWPLPFTCCGKTYYRCHHLFNKQLGSLSMQWIANGAAATKLKSPLWLMAALLDPQLIWCAYILYNVFCHAGRSDYIWSFLTSEGRSHYGPCSSYLPRLRYWPLLHTAHSLSPLSVANIL